MATTSISNNSNQSVTNIPPADPGVKLAAALSLLDAMTTRFQGHATDLQNIFGGSLHTDESMLFVTRDLIEDAKRVIDGEVVHAN